MKKILALSVALVTCAMMWADYYMAGDGNATTGWCCGKNWDAKGCKMTNGSYSATVPAGTYQFKVTNGSWSTCWGYSAVDATTSTKGYVDSGNDHNVMFTVSKEATITVTFNGSKITLTSTVPFGDATITSWTVAGVEELMGVYWDPAAKVNDMTFADNAWTLVKTNVALAAGDYDYKFVANHAWKVKEVPSSGNQTLKISKDGTYNVTFTLDAAGEKGSAEARLSTGFQADIVSSLGEYVEQNVAYSVVCTATEKASMTLYVDDVAQTSQKGTNMTVSVTFTNLGEHVVKLVATTDTKKDSSIVKTTAIAATVEEKRPAEVKMGVTYYEDSPNKVSFCTYAAGCKNEDDPSVLEHARAVYVVGNFQNMNWKMKETYRMKRDGNYFWLTLTNVTKDRDWCYQYLVVRADGKVVRISDLYATVTKENQSGADGYCAVFHTNAEAYQWSEATKNFERPDKNNLIIYEAWIYDNTLKRNLRGMIDNIDYYANLGVNCIELMPVTEFRGQKSWGYDPTHYFALDNQYGKPNDLKEFVDVCHSRGIAVVLDMVFNHATGDNPMNRLYDGDELKYNPWFNTNPPHGDNVFQDWNHDFGPTHDMVKDALAFWMDEYKVDGYRLDLSHGLCGKTRNCVKNLTDYYNSTVKPRGGYMMLEHWGSDMGNDHYNLIRAGMVCWANTSNAFLQTAQGWLNSGDDLSPASKDDYVSYPENHDEERSFFKAKMYGAGNLKTNEAARAGRVALNLGMQCMLDGPQLFYHFTEQGSEIGKFEDAFGNYGLDDNNQCAYGQGCDSSNYKMNIKNAFNYHWTKDTAVHMQAMRDVSKIIRLRTRYMPKVFEGDPTAGNLGSGNKLRTIRWGNDVVVAGNFSATDNVDYSVPSGTWYDYLNGGTKASGKYSLSPGQIKVFVGQMPASLDENREELAKNAGVKKMMLDGKIYIVRGENLYDVMGNLLR